MVPGHTDDFGSSYMVSGGIYPADTQDDRGYRIPIYLPWGSIFFVANEQDKLEENWVKVISRFGQEYYIGTNNLTFDKSDQTFDRTVKNLYGDQEYVFHGMDYFCPVARGSRNKYKDCNDDEEKKLIPRGSVAQAVEADDDEIVELKLYEESEDVYVFLRKEEFKVLIEKGLVTDLSISQPRFLRKSRIKVESLSVSCGNPIKRISYEEIEVGLSGGFSLGNFITSILGSEFSAKASKNKGDKVVLETNLGGVDHGVNAYILEVKDLRDGKARQFDIFTQTKCIASSRTKPDIYIERLEVYENGALNPLVEIEFSEIYDWPEEPEEEEQRLTTNDAPYKVWGNNNKRPFFSSINSREDYWNIHAAFLKDTEDTDLANFLISEFNASCGRRKNKLGKVPHEECMKLLPAKSVD